MQRFVRTRFRQSVLGSHQCEQEYPTQWRLEVRRFSDDSATRILSLPKQYLRSMDATNFDPFTRQRTDVSVNVDNGKSFLTTIRPETLDIAECSSDCSHYHILWRDGLRSTYSKTWVDETLQRWKRRSNANHVLWTNLTESKVRNSKTLSIPFQHSITEAGMKVSLHSLYEYGILLVTNTPIDDDGAGIAALASAFGGGSIKNNTSLLAGYCKGKHNEITLPRGTDGPLRTLYGTVWSTSSSGQVHGASVADSSYGHESLPLHTDMTYRYDPPGLQIFNMVQPSTAGGESIFGDGYAAAERLRQFNPHAFDILSKTVRRYRCIDCATGWHLEASGPVISTNKDEIVMIRHNDLDRLPDLPPSECEDVDAFYSKLQDAHLAWDQILADDQVRFVIGLRPGDTIVLANQVGLRYGRLSCYEVIQKLLIFLISCSAVYTAGTVLRPALNRLVLSWDATWVTTN